MKEDTKRVAVFVSHYPVAFSPTILDTCLFLANLGIRVDLLVDKFVFSEIEDIHPNVEVVYCTKQPPIKLVNLNKNNSTKKEQKKRKCNKSENQRKRKKNILRWFFNATVIAFNVFQKWILPLTIYSFGVARKILFKHYNYFIAFEPEGLITCALMARIKRVKFYYHSLELYEENSRAKKTRRYLEKRANKRAQFTIIQDQFKADVLIRTNNIPQEKMILFPVSQMGLPIKDKNTYFHDRFKIDIKKKIILYLGAISENTYSYDIARQTLKKEWDDNWVLIFHGFLGDAQLLKKLLVIEKSSNFFLSTQTVSQKKLDLLTSSSDIGFALYKKIDKNFEYTIYSSGKISQYLKCGVPIIVNDFSPTIAMIDKYKCGKYISNADNSIEAIRKIFLNYDEQKLNAINVFNEKYNFENNYQDIYTKLGLG